ncbi:MAG: hypothetical protein TQ35_0001460 [Candidatus Aramenus sulfurataquae]|uniref:Uncharacterized protein n=3 Tax=Candidatus Aramenus sulfurataquae TaxID=1326980 RepID=A0A0F2LPW7_9CREN|nr:hypothetical protein [Candidatus Aramenus sp.]MCL7343441.1 hypothetical protein [Candidatus Aramenus sulfurataquae]
MRSNFNERESRHRGQYAEDEPKPLPLGDKCNYLCPYFRCNKRALMIQTKYVKGNPYKAGYCRWVGDTCITGDCQYAYCEKRALLPGNKCAFAVNKRDGSRDDIERELREEDYDNKVKELLSKKLGKKDVDFI